MSFNLKLYSGFHSDACRPCQPVARGAFQGMGGLGADCYLFVHTNTTGAAHPETPEISGPVHEHSMRGLESGVTERQV